MPRLKVKDQGHQEQTNEKNCWVISIDNA